jgi:hypothetical protein
MHPPVDLPPIQCLFVLVAVFRVSMFWRQQLFGFVGIPYSFDLF